MPHVCLQFFSGGDLHILQHLFITLDDPDMNMVQIRLVLCQDLIGLVQELPDQLPLCGHGHIQNDHKIPDPLHLPALKRFHERHVLIQ